MENAQQVSDGKRIVSADKLQGGQLYVPTENESGGHLHQIRRSDDELPRIPITEEALAALRAFCRQMGKQLVVHFVSPYPVLIDLLGVAILR